jgi:macrolide transport system ATP-binding/permease protein
MEWLRVLLSRVKTLFRRRAQEESLDAELRAHLEMLEGECVRRGMSPEEARYAARREFGAIEQTKEAFREQRGIPFLENLIRDMRYGSRLLRKSPGFAVVAVLTLAVGIAVNTVVFTAFNALALRSLPVKDPKQLARVFRATQGDPYGAFSYPDYLYYRDHSRDFSDLTMMAFGMDLTSSDLPVSGQAPLPRIAGALGFHMPQLLQGSAQPIGNAFISGNYFEMLGTQPLLGRLIRPEDDRRGAIPVVVLSGNFWERQFHRSSNVVGSVLHLNGIAFVIAGVTPVDYPGTADTVPEIWLPISAKLALGLPAQQLEDRGALAGWVGGRLKPAVSLQDATAEFHVLASHLAADYPDTEAHAGATVVSGRTYAPPLDAQAWAIVVIVMAGVALLLLIACANVAGLLLARSAARLREIAVRVSLGASRTRLLQQLLTESITIAVLAGALGLIMAWWLLRLVIYEISSSLPSYWGTITLQITPDLRIFSYTLGIALIAGVAFGLTPALQSLRSDVNHALKDGGSLFGARLRGSRLRDALVSGQIAACLVLLISSALLLRGSQRALKIDPGFDIRSILLLQVSHPEDHAQGSVRFPQLARTLEQRISALPSVEAVTRASRPPTGGGWRWIAVSRDSDDDTSSPGENRPAAPEIGYSYISANYFDVLHIPLVRGRPFTVSDVETSAPVAIVSEATARQLWPGEDPVGKRIRVGKSPAASHFGERQADSAEREVIGVARDIRGMDLRKSDDGYLYLPLSSQAPWDGLFLIRTASEPTSLLSPLADTAQTLHIETPVLAGALSTMVSFNPYFVISRIGGVLATIVGSVGLLLACMGVYGMVSYSVVQRTKEVGIRMALGAQSREVQALVLRNSFRPVAIGIAVGIAASLGASQVLSAILFGLDPADAYSFVGVSALLVIVALLSGWLPARKATQVDPLIALRYE